MIKKITAKALKRLGYRITPIKDIRSTDSNVDFSPKLNVIEELPNKGWIVEFIGAIGVGKTNFYLSVEKEISEKWFWKSPIKLGKFYNGSELNMTIDDNTFDAYAELIRLKTDKCLNNENLNKFQRLHILSHTLNELKADVFSRHMEIPCGIICDDGFLHHFSPQIIQLDAGNNPNKKTYLNSIFHKRALVLFNDTLAHITNNLKKRDELHPNSSANWFAMFNHNKLSHEIQKQIEVKNNVINIAKKHQAQILIVDLADDFQENKYKFLSFLDQLN